MRTIAVRKHAMTDARMKAGLSVRALAKKAHVNPATVHKVESGKVNPSPETSGAICEALGAEFDTLFQIIEKGED